MSLETFTAAAIETLLWSETDDNGVPLDDNYYSSDIAPEALETIKFDCADFYSSNCVLFDEEHCPRCDDIDAQAGHDFILTRNGHGSGFWDGAWSDYAGKLLTEMSKPYGSLNAYVGDDKLIYVTN